MKHFISAILSIFVGHLFVGWWELNFNPLHWNGGLRWLATSISIFCFFMSHEIFKE